MIEFTTDELRALTRLLQMLLCSALDAEAEPGALETAYYKLLEQLGDEE